MVRYRLASFGLTLGIVLAGAWTGAQVDDATQALNSYYQGEDSRAVQAARSWIDHQGGALAWYYLGRIHMRHGRFQEAHEAFRSGLRVMADPSGPPSRTLRSRLKSMDRRATSLVPKQSALNRQQTVVRECALAAGQGLCEADWPRAGVQVLALAGTRGSLAKKAAGIAREAGVDQGLRLAAVLRAPGWRILVPGGREVWSRLDPRSLAEEPLSPEFSRHQLCLTPRIGAVVHPAVHGEIDRLCLDFQIASGADAASWRVGVVLRQVSPQDYHLLLFGPQSVKLRRYVAEHGETCGTWHDLATVAHARPLAPGAWYRLTVSAQERGEPARIYLNDGFLAEIDQTDTWMRGPIGLWVENETVTFRSVKVGIR